MAPNPRLILMDEPLSALGCCPAGQMRVELVRIIWAGLIVSLWISINHQLRLKTSKKNMR
jgi:ABC-type nitrate/sulfonate/bicarbonate transport system ATPase subunit